MAGWRSANGRCRGRAQTFGAPRPGVMALSASRRATAFNKLSKSRATGTPSSSSRACPAKTSSSAHARPRRQASFTDLGRRPGRSQNQPFARIAASSASRDAVASPAPAPPRRRLAAASPGMEGPFRARCPLLPPGSVSESPGLLVGGVGLASGGGDGGRSGTSAAAAARRQAFSPTRPAPVRTADPSRRATAASLHKSRAALSLSPEIVEAAQGLNLDAASSNCVRAAAAQRSASRRRPPRMNARAAAPISPSRRRPGTPARI